MSVYNYFWYFLIFSFLGWVAEVAFHAVRRGRFVNRGFLFGPVCPIYGFSVVAVRFATGEMWRVPLLLVFCSMLIATAAEFLAGFVLDKLFNKRWWDYRGERFNLFGYVCLRFALAFGVLGAAAVYLTRLLDPLISVTEGVIGWSVLGVLYFLLAADLLQKVYRMRREKRQNA